MGGETVNPFLAVQIYEMACPIFCALKNTQARVTNANVVSIEINSRSVGKVLL
jgi:hypothetical protein